MKDWEDIIKERQLGRKAELPESDWNDFLSRKAEHERAAKRSRMLILTGISVPAAAAILLLLFLMPFKTVAPDNQLAQNEPSEPQVLADSITAPIENVIEEKPQVEIAQVKPQVKQSVKQESKPEVKQEVKPEVKPEISTGIVFGGTTGFGRFTSQSSVKGRVYDFESAEPMYPAAVMIYRIDGADTTYMGGTATDENGEFVVGNLEPGNYYATTRYMGYDDANRSFTIRPGEEIADIGKITITGDVMLSEIAISAVVAKVQMVNDTVHFNSAVYKLPEGESVEDLIRKLPGVKIDSAGNITVNGKSVSRILVNGKEFFNDDKTQSLTRLTADMIEKVKAYEKQSDLSRQTGIDDGEEEQVMDLNYQGSISGVASTFKTPLIVFDGNVVEVDKDRLAAFDFSRSYNDRDSLSSLLGVKRGKINVLKASNGREAVEKWGAAGENGVLEVFSGKYYRRSLRAGKLDGGPYEIVPRSKRTR